MTRRDTAACSSCHQHNQGASFRQGGPIPRGKRLELTSVAASKAAVRCRVCAHDNAIDNKFCTNCGTPLEAICPACGRGRATGSNFCGWCGAPQTEGSRLIEPPGERKQATVLFADIVGSTELIAGLDAEAAKDRLQPVVRAMVDVVRRFNGTVLRTLGDGLKAAFGLPHAREGHALLACRAALAMQDAMAALPVPTKIRIGLHSGEVVGGTLDTGSGIEQDAQGMTVHIASRIEQAANPGEISISGDCWALVRAYCEAVSIGVQELRGIPGAIEIFRLIGLTPAVNSDHFRGGGLTRLRGRSAELDILRQALLDAGEYAGSVIGVAAQAGAGKSRLCFEFGEWCRERRIDVLEARAHVLGQATPLVPVLEMLRSFFGVSPGLDAAAVRRNISERMLALDPALEDGVTLLAELLNVADPELNGQTLDPRTRHSRLRDIVGRMVKAGGRRTSVIIIEDLHWLDEASQDFIETMAESVRGTKIVMVMTFRPPWPARWSPGSDYHEIRLTDLGPEDMCQIVRDLTGDAPELAPVVTRVADQSGGNPFFAQELVLSLAQTGVLLGARGKYRLAPSGWNNPVLPATVEAVIGARIDHLTERLKTVLQIGAVIGKEFPLAVVREVAGIPEPALPPLFDQLCAEEMVQPCVTYAGASFAFRHPLIQEVAYAMQLRATRTRLHEAVANTIRRFDWGLRDESAGLLAHHYEAAGQTLEAVSHLQRAARWIGQTNSARAMADWRKARRMLQGLPESEVRDQLRALADGQLLNFGWREGMTVEEAKVYAEEALRYARKVGDRRHEANLLGGYGRIMATSGAADDYVRLVREALTLSDAKANPEGNLLLTGMLCQAWSRAGLQREALKANDAALAAIEAAGDSDASAALVLSARQMVGFDVAHWVRCLRASVLVALGRFEEADLWLARLMQKEDVSIEPVIQFIPHFAAVELAWHRGNAAAADRHASEVARFAEQSAIPFVIVAAQLCNGLSASVSGDFRASERHLLLALEAARKSGAGLEQEARLLALLAEAYVRTGDRAEAEDISAKAMDAARRRTDRYAECHAAIVGAMALVARSRTDRLGEAEELLGLADRLIALTGAVVFRPMLERAQMLVDTGELSWS
jgi:class 3 adenylate cyclase/tetratricopeptide (TPR) repeat protein